MTFAIIRAQPTAWRRTVAGRSEKALDERRLTVDARPHSKSRMQIVGAPAFEGLKLQMQIFNLPPNAIGGEDGPQLPPKCIGLVQWLPDYECVVGWFSVGPENFNELWAAGDRPLKGTTLELWLTPIEFGNNSDWLWDPEKTPFLYVEKASLDVLTELADDKPKRKSWFSH